MRSNSSLILLALRTDVHKRQTRTFIENEAPNAKTKRQQGKTTCSQQPQFTRKSSLGQAFEVLPIYSVVSFVPLKQIICRFVNLGR